MPNETVCYQRFRARVEYLEQHMQVVDLAITMMFKETHKHRNAQTTVLGALGYNTQHYTRVNHPVNHAPRLFNYSRSKNFEHILVSLYRHFSEYLRGILGEMFSANPLLVVGKAPSSSTITYAELVKLGNYSAIASQMIGVVFRKLEDERSTLKLLDKVLDHTGVTLTQPIKDTALMYLEMRHLFIHNDGKVDQQFFSKYGTASMLKVGDKLPTNYRTTSFAIAAVTDLLLSIDSQLIAKGLAVPRP